MGNLIKHFPNWFTADHLIAHWETEARMVMKPQNVNDDVMKDSPTVQDCEDVPLEYESYFEPKSA